MASPEHLIVFIDQAPHASACDMIQAFPSELHAWCCFWSDHEHPLGCRRYCHSAGETLESLQGPLELLLCEHGHHEAFQVEDSLP